MNPQTQSPIRAETLSGFDQKFYDEWLDCLIIEAVSNGVGSFCSLVLSLPGVYPAVVLRTVRRLAESGTIPIQTGTFCTREAVLRRPPILPSLNGEEMPVPHPLDYEWRFSRQASGKLLDTCLRLSSHGDAVVTLGVPSLFRHFGTQQQSDRRFMICDVNKAVLEAFAQSAHQMELVHWNVIGDNLPPVSAQCVVLDAPWYLEYIQAFLWVASQICVPGGHILVSLPPLGTRPGIAQERQHLLTWAQSASLRLAEWQPSALGYESPFFERNALSAEGVINYPSQWRRGDLAVFVSEGKTSLLPRPIIDTEAHQWSEYVLQGVRIRVRQRDQPIAIPNLISLIPGDILPSVSRRDGRRTQATLWTSGNRIFRCDACRGLEIILSALVKDQSPLPQLQQELGRCLAQSEYDQAAKTLATLKEVIRLERNEMDQYCA